MGHDAGYKCGIVNGPLGIFGDLERPQDGCRSDIERSVSVAVMSQVDQVDYSDHAVLAASIECRTPDGQGIDLPKGKIRSDTGSPSESKRVSFQFVVDATVRSYPAFRVEHFWVGEYVGVARDAPVRDVRRSDDHTRILVYRFGLPVVPEHGCSRRDVVTILEV